MIILNSIRFLIYKIVPSWLYYKIAFFVKKERLKKANKIFCNNNNNLIIYEFLKKTKKYEKVFIFGSGRSINELSVGNYKEINKNCSIGINKWIFHNFITNYYMLELTPDDSLNEKFRLRIHQLLKNKSKNPIFLIHKGRSDQNKMQNWMTRMPNDRVFLYEYLRPDIYKKNKRIEFIKSLKFLSKKNKICNVLTLGVGATLERAISLTLLLGYSNIIILGVDLNDTKVFWNDSDTNFKGIKSGQKEYGLHKTAIKRQGGLPVQNSIVILDEIAREYYDSRILITTKNSLLSSKIEKYEFKNK